MAATAPDPLRRRRARPVVYPTRDGEPLGETDTHRDLMMYLIEALKVFFADRPDVYVSGDNFLYWEEGNPRKCVSPDCYVVFGVEMKQRDCYKAWEEGGRLPDMVIEVTSRKTRREDTDRKRPLYEQVLKVPEYLLFDPTGDYLRPRLQGYRLEGDRYAVLEPQEGSLYSQQLGLQLVEDGKNLQLVDPERGERLLSLLEQVRLAEAAAVRAAAADRRVEAVERENTRLREELEALRRKA